jgi:hypothetical protein
VPLGGFCADDLPSPPQPVTAVVPSNAKANATADLKFVVFTIPP